MRFALCKKNCNILTRNKLFEKFVVGNAENIIFLLDFEI
jgi:hypothetical protein